MKFDLKNELINLSVGNWVVVYAYYKEPWNVLIE